MESSRMARKNNKVRDFNEKSGEMNSVSNEEAQEVETVVSADTDAYSSVDTTGAVEIVSDGGKEVTPVQNEVKIALSVDPLMLRDKTLIMLYDYFHDGEDFELFDYLQKGGSKIVNDFNYVDFLCWKKLFKVLESK